MLKTIATGVMVFLLNVLFMIGIIYLSLFLNINLYIVYLISICVIGTIVSIFEALKHIGDNITYTLFTYAIGIFGMIIASVLHITTNSMTPYFIWLIYILFLLLSFMCTYSDYL